MSHGRFPIFSSPFWDTHIFVRELFQQAVPSSDFLGKISQFDALSSWKSHENSWILQIYHHFPYEHFHLYGF
jgi:hypothetical protein